MRKPKFCLYENKGADQLCSYCSADQRLCFCYTDSTIPSQASLCQDLSEAPKTGFIVSRLILFLLYNVKYRSRIAVGSCLLDCGSFE